jgi:hypothetical protein
MNNNFANSDIRKATDIISTPGGYLMTDGVLNGRRMAILLKRNGVSMLICFRCGKHIEKGSMIHSSLGNTTGRLNTVRVYHAECFEKMFINLDS